MKKAILATLILALAPSLAHAQSPDYSKRHGYVYFAPGLTAPEGEGTIHLGGGWERFFHRHVGMGLEGGFLAPVKSIRDGIGTSPPNLVARVRAKSNENKIEPFVTGGYTLLFREGTANGVNLGGGVNWWFKERVGLRFEVRDNVFFADGELGQLFGFRVGFTFK